MVLADGRRVAEMSILSPERGLGDLGDRAWLRLNEKRENRGVTSDGIFALDRWSKYTDLVGLLSSCQAADRTSKRDRSCPVR